MTKKAGLRKRSCKICGKEFVPNPKSGCRQKTCGGKECQREWHRRKCAEWNRKNKDYFRGIYLRKKLEASKLQTSEKVGASKPQTSEKAVPIEASPLPVDLRLRSGIDPHDFQEVFTVQQAIVIEYIIGQFVRPLQDSIASIIAHDTC